MKHLHFGIERDRLAPVECRCVNGLITQIIEIKLSAEKTNNI